LNAAEKAMIARRFVILCVDDEQISLRVRSLVLEKAGHEVIPASSAMEALDILQSRSVDLVLTDLLMPGMSGADLAREVKIQSPNLPVVLFSGVNELPPEQSHADLFVSKLEGPIFLCERVAEILQRHQKTVC
jgi:CheY-like chemotaxis protein